MDEVSLSPLTGYWVDIQSDLSDVDSKTLTNLYLPIIGADANSLYLYFWQDKHQNQIISERDSHSKILTILDMDIQTFKAARDKLEALGLVQTFEKSDQIGNYLIYKVCNPLLPNEFFNDSLMSTLLYEKVGEKYFTEISEKYQYPTVNYSDSKEISKSFLDVFELSEQDLLDVPDAVSNNQDNNRQSNKSILKLDQNQVAPLDWDLLAQLLSGFGITKQDIEENETDIYNLHAFYNLSEIELANYIKKTMNVAENKIDFRRLERTIQKQYENQSNVKLRVANNVEDEEQMSDNNSEFYNEVENNIPSEYLALQKQKKNGFVGSSETRVLKKLQNRNILSNSVINVLISYVLSVSSTLSEGLVETVANDWAQNGVKTAEDAVKRLNDFSNNRGRKQNNRRGGKVEKGTDWKKKQPKTENNGNLDESKQSALDRLKNLDN